MKLSQKTLSILKNFSTINSGIMFKKGTILSTVSPQKNILADAHIEEMIPQDFGIYSLSGFLSVVSLFKEGAELEFESKNIIIKGMNGRSKIKYRCADPSMIVVAPEKRPNLPSIDVSFLFSEENFDWIMRTANILGCPNIAIESDGTNVNLVAFDVTDDSSHSNYTTLPDIKPEGNEYKLIFKTENLKMLPRTYNVEISSKGIAKFVDKDNELIYYVTLETSSVYN